MKKLIAASSLATMLVFAVVLAKANDVSSENPNDAQNYDSESTIQSSNPERDRLLNQSPGQAPDTSNSESLPPPQLKPKENESPSPTCTDEKGVLFNKNDRGYTHCRNMQRLRREETSDQN